MEHKPKKINFSESEMLFIRAHNYNWDDGLDFLEQTLNNANCDKGTASLIYWRNDPKFFYKYENTKDIPAWSIDGYNLMKLAESKLLNQSLAEIINYSPEEEDIAKSKNVLKKIDPQLLKPTSGNTKADEIVDLYYKASYLIDACKENDLQKVKTRLDKDASVIDLFIDFDNPLLTSIDKTNIEIVEFLLSQGANLNARHHKNEGVPILILCRQKKSIKLFELLVKYGADINEGGYKNNTLLHFYLDNEVFCWEKACGSKLLTDLLKLGANPNLKNEEGRTPLDYAVKYDNQKALKILEKFS